MQAIFLSRDEFFFKKKNWMDPIEIDPIEQMLNDAEDMVLSISKELKSMKHDYDTKYQMLILWQKYVVGLRNAKMLHPSLKRKADVLFCFCKRAKSEK